jgi:hypothetical protein
MGKHARIGLLLGASACLLAAMGGWPGRVCPTRKSPRACSLPRTPSSTT